MADTKCPLCQNAVTPPKPPGVLKKVGLGVLRVILWPVAVAVGLNQSDS